MKFLKKPRKVKGMTLVEIIIALFVFVVASAVMVKMGAVANQLLRNSSHVERRTSIEAPLAENANTNATFVENSNLKVTVTIPGASVNVKGTSYTTQKQVATNQAASTIITDADIEYVSFDLEQKGGDGIWVDPTPTT